MQITRQDIQDLKDAFLLAVKEIRMMRVEIAEKFAAQSDKYISTAEAAKMLRCGEENVRRMIGLGKITATKAPASDRWLVDRASLEARINARISRKSKG